MNDLRSRLRRPTMVEMSVLAAIWLPVGFATGTLTLLGPVRWVTTALRGAEAGDTVERLAVLAIIATYVVLSLALSVWMTRATLAAGHVAVRVAYPAAAVVAAAASMWLWMSPDLVNGLQPVQTRSIAQFTFGPYPEAERLAELKAEGFTAVVSLLHPAVVPFEPRLMERERLAAEAAGIELIQAPMLPWISDNVDALNTIRELAASATGRYYVHCYLGRDRVGAVRSLVERVTGSTGRVADGRGAEVPYGVFKRTAFERGAVTEIDAGVYLAPYPTDEEFLGVVSGTFQHVVSLLDPNNEDDRQWIAREEAIMESYAVPFSLIPVPWKEFDPATALAAANRIRTLDRPVLVHAFRADATAIEAVRLAYLTGLAPVAAKGFEDPMAAGTPTVLAPNVVVGPRPNGPEFGSFLRRRGIRAIAWVGEVESDTSRRDRIIATREANLQWRAFDPSDTSLLATLAAGGPWYVYGPALGVVQSRLSAGLRPPSEYTNPGGSVAAAGMN